MDWSEYVVSNPEVLNGKPAIKGTRLAVEYLLERLSEGMAIEQLLENYPRLRREHIYAALAYAADSIKNDGSHELAQPSWLNRDI